MRINVEAPIQYKWNPETAVKLWSNNKIRRVTQTKKRQPEPHHKKYPQHSDEESETESFSLDEWLQWISGTDTIIEDNDPSEAEADLQETGLSNILQT